MRTSSRILALGAAVALTAALSVTVGCCRQGVRQAQPTDSTGAATGDPMTFFYDCEGQRFTVRIHADTASVMVPDKTLVLLQVPSASGAKYTDGTTTFWSKGEEATLTLAGQTHKGCKRHSAW